MWEGEQKPDRVCQASARRVQTLEEREKNHPRGNTRGNMDFQYLRSLKPRLTNVNIKIEPACGQREIIRGPESGTRIKISSHVDFGCKKNDVLGRQQKASGLTENMHSGVIGTLVAATNSTHFMLTLCRSIQRAQYSAVMNYSL